ncbi:MAG TPA: GNAT family N-acetyltransferase [Mycobacteriales bacterium]|nr:GNAT family N-acetyltransferase [Mycobacteriales bacterium]
MRTSYDDCDFDDDLGRLDRDAVWHFLADTAYWAKNRTREMFDRQLASAWRVVGVYSADRTIGFARAVSDGVALAYLADVFVLPEFRGRGLGVELVRVMVEDGPGHDLRWMLHTADAHGLYARFGFAPPDSGYLERPTRLPVIRP